VAPRPGVGSVADAPIEASLDANLRLGERFVEWGHLATNSSARRRARQSAGAAACSL